MGFFHFRGFRMTDTIGLLKEVFVMLVSQEKYGIFGYDAEAERERKQKKQAERKEKLLWTAALSFFILLLGVFFSAAWLRVKDRPVLQLKEETVTLRKGDPFEAMQYVQTAEGRGTLHLPERIDTSRPGRKAAVYRLEYGHRQVMRTLLVNVEEEKTD